MANISPTKGTLEELCQVLAELGNENVCVDGSLTKKLLEQPDMETLHETVQNLYAGYARLQEHFGRPPHSLEHLDYLFLWGSLWKRNLYQERMRPLSGMQPYQIRLTEEDKKVLAEIHNLQEKYNAERLKILDRTPINVLFPRPSKPRN